MTSVTDLYQQTLRERGYTADPAQLRAVLLEAVREPVSHDLGVRRLPFTLARRHDHAVQVFPLLSDLNGLCEIDGPMLTESYAACALAKATDSVIFSNSSTGAAYNGTSMCAQEAT